MDNYSRNEKLDMLLIYGEARKNAVVAARLYAERYPNRRHPTRHYFPKMERKLRNEAEDGNQNQFIVSEDKEIEVLALVQVENTTSLREIALQCEISVSSVWRILKKYKYRSFKYQLHQHLYPNDQGRRLEYCNWFLEQYENDPRFPFKIIYSDECRFTNLGMFNRNNKRYWAQENNNQMIVGHFQERFGFNCWMGIMGERMLGPIFFYGNLTGERYLNFLQNEIEALMDNVPLANVVGVFFQQDGAPPHNVRLVSEYLNRRFQENWIGTNGPIRWPPR